MTIASIAACVRKSFGILKNTARSGWRVLLEPRLHDEDDRRREYILNILLAITIVMLAVFDAMVGYYAISGTSGHTNGVSVLAFSGFLIFFFGLYALSRRGSIKIASYLFVAAFFIGNSYAAYHWSITVPTMLVGYALLVVMAGMVVDSRFGFIMAGVSAVCVVVMWRIQLDGLAWVDPDELTMGDGISLAALYFFITAVAWLSNRQIEGSLARARRSEEALMKQRDRLEIEVEERTRELRDIQFAKVEQLYRFAEFGQLASGLFHDLVNFFNAVLLHMQEPDDASAAGMTQAQDRLETAGVLTKQVNDFVEAMHKQFADSRAEELFSVSKEIGQVVQLLSYTARKRNIHISLESEEADFFGDCFKFHQVVMNLILNAIESYEDIVGEDIRERVVSVRVKNQKENIEISVSDHGAGISHDVREKIFKPFFTTKQDGKGIGIGLAITKKVVENDFKGTLTFESEVGVGTKFLIRIPRQNSN